MINEKDGQITNARLIDTTVPLYYQSTFAISNTDSIAAVFGSLPISPLWWALSLGIGFGGNGTIISSSVGIVATVLAEINDHKITFNQFLKVGFPFKIVSVADVSIMLLIDTLIRLYIAA